MGHAPFPHFPVLVEEDGRGVFDQILLAAHPKFVGVVGDVVRPVEPDEIDARFGELSGMAANDAPVARVVLAQRGLVPRFAVPQVAVGPQAVGDAHFALGRSHGPLRSALGGRALSVCSDAAGKTHGGEPQRRRKSENRYVLHIRFG